jgi:ABC-type transporter Mla maintaining outer membrane lipid asymmetry permease subunit MlaE
MLKRVEFVNRNVAAYRSVLSSPKEGGKEYQLMLIDPQTLIIIILVCLFVGLLLGINLMRPRGHYPRDRYWE